MKINYRFIAIVIVMLSTTILGYSYPRMILLEDYTSTT